MHWPFDWNVLVLLIGFVFAGLSVRRIRSKRPAVGEAVKRAVGRQAVAFGLLGAAFVMGYATHSVKVFTVLFVAGLAVRIALLARDRRRG